MGFRVWVVFSGLRAKGLRFFALDFRIWGLLLGCTLRAPKRIKISR